MSKFCKNCGAELNPNNKFCVLCGIAIIASSTQQTVEATPLVHNIKKAAAVSASVFYVYDMDKIKK